MYLYYLLGWKGYNVKNPQKITVSFSVWLSFVIEHSVTSDAGYIKPHYYYYCSYIGLVI